MDFIQLEFIRAVAEEGTVAAAALRLRRVPSNLTTRIRQLEAELGVELFIREKSRLRLSPAGQTFLGYAGKILSLAEDARRVGHFGEPKGSFRLGSQESTAAVRIPSLLAIFHRRYPAVELDLTTGASGDVIQGIVDGQLSAGFVDGPLLQHDLEGIKVYEEEICIIAAQTHAPIRRARDVAGETIYAFRSNCSYRRHFENWFARDGVAPGRILELESYHGMLACVTAGAGLALIPRSMLLALPGHSEVSSYALDSGFDQVVTWLAWRRGTQLANLDAFIKTLQDHSEIPHLASFPSAP